jgi:acyl-CoA hydrolase
VTASVDAIELARQLDLSRDMSITGQVVWTGRSSLDIRMELRQGEQQGEQQQGEQQQGEQQQGEQQQQQPQQPQQRQQGGGHAPGAPALVALFSFVALDPVAKRAIAINPLQVGCLAPSAGAGMGARAGAGAGRRLTNWRQAAGARRCGKPGLPGLPPFLALRR